MGEPKSTGLTGILVEKRGEDNNAFIFEQYVSPLEEFRQDYKLPRTAYFLYLQICHTAATQFGLRNITISHTKLVSTYYRSLLHSTTHRLSSKANKWRADIPELTEDIWQEVLPLQVPSVISSRDKVIQTKLLYRSYFTPSLLFKLNRLPSALCSRCGMADGTFFHLMWECSPIKKFWSEVTAFISSLTQRIVLFCAKKSITIHWKSQSSPTIAFWLTTVNHAILLYKLTYEARGCPKKFLKIWDSWVSSESTIPPAP